MSDDNFITGEEMLADIKRLDPDFKPDNVEYIRSIPLADKLKPLNFKEIMDREVSPIDYMLYPILPTQGIAFIYAATGVGKTLFALNLAYTMASGGSFLKYKSPKLRRVMYIDGEMPFNQVKERLTDIAKIQGKLFIDDNFKILTPDCIYPVKMPKIDDLHGQEFYEKFLDLHNCEVAIFDNVSVLSSFDENKAHEWTSVQNFFLNLRAKGKAVFIIHHAGKDKSGYRGSSKMLDCADTAISLELINQDCLEDENINIKKIKISYEKNRGFWGKDALSFEANLEKWVWSHKSYEQTQIDKVLDRLKANMSQRDIAIELGIDRNKVYRLIEKAKLQGKV